ncbi:hypothetical protein HMPREF3197_05020 [Klebsiella pneumoniae]|nr:hypothetical protein HMPREF3197_05020 [Klebsiella pneumoniae]
MTGLIYPAITPLLISGCRLGLLQENNVGNLFFNPLKNSD